MNKFAALDPQKAELVKLRYFVGITVEEAAEVLGISLASAKRHWAYARAFSGKIFQPPEPLSREIPLTRMKGQPINRKETMKNITRINQTLPGAVLPLLLAPGHAASAQSVSRIAFHAPVTVRKQHATCYQIFSMNPDGSQVVQLTSTAATSWGAR